MALNMSAIFNIGIHLFCYMQVCSYHTDTDLYNIMVRLMMHNYEY